MWRSEKGVPVARGASLLFHGPLTPSSTTAMIDRTKHWRSRSWFPTRPEIKVEPIGSYQRIGHENEEVAVLVLILIL